MTATLNFQVRDYMRDLYPEHRWGLLTMLILYADIRNRCWPSVDRLAHDMGLSPTKVSTAKKWLLEHGAIELVPYGKRVGDERKLPARQHVYQLTGRVEIDGKDISYLYFQAPEVAPVVNPTDHSNFNPTDHSNTGVDNTTVGRGSIYIEDSTSKDSSLSPVASASTPDAPATDEKPVAPPKPKKTPINQPLKDAIAVHLQGLSPNEAVAITGLLANKAMGIWTNRLGVTSLTAEQYEKVARSIPEFVKWFWVSFPYADTLPTKLDTFENRYQQFVSGVNPKGKPKDTSAWGSPDSDDPSTWLDPSLMVGAA